MDFLSLILYPDTSVYKSNVSLTVFYSFTDALPNNRVSFAKREWVTEICDFGILMPCHMFWEDFIFIIWLRASAIIIKREGDKGSPCLTHWVEEEKPDGVPLIITEKIALEMHALIYLHHFIEKPNLLRTLNKNSHLSLSYAFIISSLTTKADRLCELTECKTSWATSAPSTVSLLGTNLPYSGEIILVINL